MKRIEDFRYQSEHFQNDYDLGGNMRKLIKPKKLQVGDKVATVSLSWGGAGDSDLLWRYEQGKNRLEDVFGLKVVEMPNTLKGTKYISEHPEKRAKDLMDAFADPSIKGILCCIGGSDSVRMLPYIDFDIIRNNPKIFVGYSDTTISHYMCFKAGLSSFYGPAILTDFAENVTMSDYTVEWIKRTLFSNEVIGEILSAKEWTSEFLPWEIENKNIRRKFNKNNGYQLLQGEGIVTGNLIGGCMDSHENIKGTDLFPDLSDFNNSILFFETSEEMPSPTQIERWLRNYGTMGVLGRINGLIFGKPYEEKYLEEYKISILKILKEYNREDLPVLYNMSFGHCEPKCCIPYGAIAEINCNRKAFSILESGCI